MSTTPNPQTHSVSEMSPTPQANDNGGNVNNAANDQSDAAMADQAANTNNDQPPAYEAPAQEGPAAARLTIVFKNQAGAETQFKLKNTTPMVKATDAYHATHGVTAGAYRFLFDGIRVLDAHTPKEVRKSALFCFLAVQVVACSCECVTDIFFTSLRWKTETLSMFSPSSLVVEIVLCEERMLIEDNSQSLDEASQGIEITITQQS